jgi:hypothetical protein
VGTVAAGILLVGFSCAKCRQSTARVEPAIRELDA